MKQTSTIRASSSQFSVMKTKSTRVLVIKCSNSTHTKSSAANIQQCFSSNGVKRGPALQRVQLPITTGVVSAEWKIVAIKEKRTLSYIVGSDGYVKKVEAVRSSVKIQSYTKCWQIDCAQLKPRLGGLEVKVTRTQYPPCIC